MKERAYMATHKPKHDFFATEEGHKIKEQLHRMSEDESYTTGSSYIANTALYPDNSISFVDKHVRYLKAHPSVNPQHYVSNLRLMTRVR